MTLADTEVEPDHDTEPWEEAAREWGITPPVTLPGARRRPSANGSMDRAAPWVKANENDRERARALVARYGINGNVDTAELAGFFSCREHEIRNARWLAIAGGMIEKRGGVWKPTRKGEREVI